MVVGAGEAGLGLFQRLLRGALFGLGQLAVRGACARAQLVRLRPWRRFGGGPGASSVTGAGGRLDQRAHQEILWTWQEMGLREAWGGSAARQTPGPGAEV